ncbi:hypothetical protein PO124_04465 [Bacillus licheniformis]|nr:hypothetical protein [Bacillus licheniformis]
MIKRLDLTGILLFAGGIVLLLAFLLSLSTGEPRLPRGCSDSSCFDVCLVGAESEQSVY